MSLDRYIKIGAVTMPRWIAGRDALDGELDEVTGTGYLVHQSEPRFVCRWRVGEPPLSPLSYSDAALPGEDDADNLSLYDFVWTDDTPSEDAFRSLMREAVAALDNFVQRLNEEYE